MLHSPPRRQANKADKLTYGSENSRRPVPDASGIWPRPASGSQRCLQRAHRKFDCYIALTIPEAQPSWPQCLDATARPPLDPGQIPDPPARQTPNQRLLYWSAHYGKTSLVQSQPILQLEALALGGYLIPRRRLCCVAHPSSLPGLLLFFAFFLSTSMGGNGPNSCSDE